MTEWTRWITALTPAQWIWAGVIVVALSLLTYAVEKIARRIDRCYRATCPECIENFAEENIR